MQITLTGIVDFINGTRCSLIASTEGLAPAQVDFSPGQDRWAIGQLLRHVALTEAGIGRGIGMLVDRAQRQGLRPRRSEMVDLFIFEQVARQSTGKRFQAPPHVVPAPGIALVEVLAELEAARRVILDFAPALGARDMTGLCFPHPFFGDFNPYQWLYFLGLHESRHCQQIEALKESPNFPGSAG